MTEIPNPSDTFDIMQLGRKVDPTPRVLDALLGGALVLVAVRGRSLASLLVGAYGAHRLYRAATGHLLTDTVKEVTEALGSRASLKHKHGSRRDNVDEASWESFPASDPPAYSP